MSTPFVHSALLAAVPGFVHGFTTRHGGVSQPPFDTANYGMGVDDDPAAVEENLVRLGRAAGFALARLYTANQVHGAEVVRVAPGDDAADIGHRQADALWTSARGVTLGVRVADCVPIVLVEGSGRGFAVVHAGWRGTARRVLARAIEGLRRELGVRASALRAAIGPAIGPECFEVGDEVVQELRAAVPGPESHWRLPGKAPGKAQVDLWNANLALLEAAGVETDVIRRCTSCEAAEFFSHRRDRGRTGRHLAFATLAE